MIVNTSSAVVMSNLGVLILLIVGAVGTNAGIVVSIMCHFDMDRITPPILRMLVKLGWSAGIIILLLSSYFRITNMNKRTDYIENYLSSETGCVVNYVKNNTYEIYKDGKFQGFAYSEKIDDEQYEIKYSSN